ncbi:MAG: transporter substrate-binding domain-containing protein [Campylobacteraceae bacterium]|nr:transporter substrate-binding domain-containing protein [Campylobacteraceae bacterium]
MFHGKELWSIQKGGNYDGLLGAYYKEERTSFFQYSQEIDQTQIVFFTKNSKNIQYDKFTDLSKYVIGVVRAYHYTKEFDKAKKYLHLFEANHVRHNIKLLIHDRVDLILGSKKVILALLNKHYPQYVSQIKFITPILQSNKLYVTISKKRKNHKRIISDFNEGLQEIIEDGTYDKILKLYNF